MDIERMQQEKHLVSKMLPELGASQEAIDEAIAFAEQWWYLPSVWAVIAYGVVVLVQKFFFGVDITGGILTAAVNIVHASIIIMVAYMVGFVRRHKARLVLDLCAECNDSEWLNVVSELADYPGTAKTLKNIVQRSQRDYLCWYEVLHLIQTGQYVKSLADERNVKAELWEKIKQ